MPTRERALIVGVAALAVSAFLAACSGSEDSRATRPLPSNTSPMSDSPVPAKARVVETSMDRAKVVELPWRRSWTTPLPRTIPGPGTPLPSLLEHLPGRAVLVVNPHISSLGAPVNSWSDIRLEFFGVDGHWARLSLGDLGLSDDLTFTDTYGAGELSSDGRWWAGSTRTGVVVLNLASGTVRMIRNIGLGTWIPGRHALLSDHETVTVPQGRVRRVPYTSAQVGYQPDGTPLSWSRGEGGEAVLVEWHGHGSHPRALVKGVEPPPRRGLLWSVQATRGRVATSALQSPGASIAVFDSYSGEPQAILNHKDGSELSYQAWIDPETLLIARTPYFLAWRPANGKLFRVTDARLLRGYWDVDFAGSTTVP